MYWTTWYCGIATFTERKGLNTSSTPGCLSNHYTFCSVMTVYCLTCQRESWCGSYNRLLISQRNTDRAAAAESLFIILLYLLWIDLSLGIQINWISIQRRSPFVKTKHERKFIPNLSPSIVEIWIMSVVNNNSQLAAVSILIRAVAKNYSNYWWYYPIFLMNWVEI